MQAEQSDFDDTQLSSLLQERLALREQREQRLAVARNALEDVAGELREIEQERMGAEKKLHPLREGIKPGAPQGTRGPHCRRSVWGATEGIRCVRAGTDSLSWENRPFALQAEINRLNGEITALGAVNLGALDELESSQTRKTYLDSQSQDLEEASDTLKDAIRQIDR